MLKKKKMRRWKKVLIGLVIVSVIAMLAGKRFISGKKVEPVKTTKVMMGNVVEKLTETGIIELLRTVEVKSKIAGTVKQILVKDGDTVKKGQVLCIIDPDPTQTLLLFQKRSAVDRTRINMEQAKKEMNRKHELAKSALISPQDLEVAENIFLISQNAFNLAKQELEIMEREIETTGSGTEERIASSKVIAPYDGYITQRYVEEGTIVTSGISSVVAGTNLFQIGDPSTMIIKTFISEVDIGKVKIGVNVDITLDAYPDTSFAGNIRHISPVGSLQQGRNVVSFKTEVEIIDRDPRHKPGMSCDVDVILAREDSVTYLPVETVYELREGSKEDGNETVKNIIYVKTETDSTQSKKQKKSFINFSRKKTDPLDEFVKQEIELGLKSENRVNILADIDTTVVVASDAEKFFKDLEARDKKKKNGKDKKKEE